MASPETPPAVAAPQRKKDLRELLDEEIKAAEEEGRQNGGQVSADRLASIERLKKLIDLGNERRERRSNRWIATGVVVGGLIVSVLLLTMRVASVDVTISATTSFVAFHPTTDLTLLAPLLAATSVHASDLDSATITGSASGRDTSLRVSTLDFARGPRGSIAVASIPVVPHQPVRLGSAGRELTISTGPAVHGEKVELNGTIEMGGDIRRSMSLRDGSAQLWYGPNGTELRATLVDSTTQRALTTVVRIDTLELFQRSRTDILSDGQPKSISAVHDGKLIFRSIDSSMIELGPADVLELDGLDGELSAVQYTPGGLAIVFRGAVKEAHASNGLSRRNLKPVLFDYLRARHTAVLIWGSIAWALGTVLAIARWWRRPNG